MTESHHQTNEEPVSWHWTEGEISIDAILRKNKAIRRIHNKLKEKRRNVYRDRY